MNTEIEEKLAFTLSYFTGPTNRKFRIVANAINQNTGYKKEVLFNLFKNL